MFAKKKSLEQVESRVLFAVDSSIEICVDGLCGPLDEVAFDHNDEDFNELIVNEANPLAPQHIPASDSDWNFFTNSLGAISDATHSLDISHLSASLKEGISYGTAPLSAYTYLFLNKSYETIPVLEKHLSESIAFVSGYTHDGVDQIILALNAFEEALKIISAHVSDFTHNTLLKRFVFPGVFDYAFPALETTASWTSNFIASLYNDVAIPAAKFSYEKGQQAYDWSTDQFESGLHQVSDLVHGYIVLPVVDQAAHTGNYLLEHPYETTARIVYAGINNGIPVAINLGVMVAINCLSPDHSNLFAQWSAPVFFGAQAARFAIDHLSDFNHAHNEELKVDQSVLLSTVSALGATMMLPTHSFGLSNLWTQSTAMTIASVPFYLNVRNDLLKEATFATMGREMDQYGFFNSMADIDVSYDGFEKLIFQDFTYSLASVESAGLQLMNLFLGQPLHPIGAQAGSMLLYVAFDNLADASYHKNITANCTIV